MATDYDEAIIPLIKMAGPLLCKKRVELKMTMMDVALATNGFVNGNFLSALENGKVGGGVTFYRLALLAEVYKIPPKAFFELFGMGNLLQSLGMPNDKYRIITEGEENE